MNRHAGPPPDPNAPPPVPEPTYAERARTLVHRARTGTLATLSRRHPGYPFASLMPYALDGIGRPLFLISAMAVHTQNLAEDSRASLFVAEPDWTGDPLAAGRITLLGAVEPVPGEARAEARAAYLARHPNASYWVDFEDFAFHRLEIADLYFVGGFAAMDWIDASAYKAARVDPLADVAAGILEHMNRDHADALVVFARSLAGAPEAEAATMVAVDRLGFRLRIRTGGRLHAERIPFPEEVATADDTRRVLIRMLQDARARG
jgi:heme oxygenase (biliverdin-IX-beta and delta-forming)